MRASYRPTYPPTNLHTFLPTYLPTYLRTYLPNYRSTDLPTDLPTYRLAYVLTYVARLVGRVLERCQQRLAHPGLALGIRLAPCMVRAWCVLGTCLEPTRYQGSVPRWLQAVSCRAPATIGHRLAPTRVAGCGLCVHLPRRAEAAVVCPGVVLCVGPPSAAIDEHRHRPCLGRLERTTGSYESGYRLAGKDIRLV